jgi:hypothetical protein
MMKEITQKIDVVFPKESTRYSKKLKGRKANLFVYKHALDLE